ncbi:MAG: ATP-binding cassette domain-containing protein [Verrucomicrobiales bacterium]|nr:ATP-binding cassette domain-containing protein [Verrucomicrobiales bacterium]
MSEDTSKPNKEKQTSLLRGAWELLSCLTPYNRYFIPALFALCATTFLVLLFPRLMGELVGGSMMNSGAGEDINVDEVLSSRNKVAITLAVVLCVQAVVAYFRINWFAKAGESALADLRKRVYSRLVRLPMTYFGEHRIGELSSRLAADLSLIRDTLVTTTPQMLRQLLTLLGCLVMIFITSLKLSLFMLACLPVVIIATALVGRKIRGQSKLAQDQMAESNVIVEETLQSIVDVKAFHNENHEIGRYHNTIDKFLGTALRTAKAKATFVSFIIFVMFGVITLVVWYGAGLLAVPPTEGGLTSAQFFQFILYTVFLSGALGSLPEAVSQVQKAVGATERVREILGEQAEPVVMPSEMPGGRLKGDVVMDNVGFAYPSRADHPVLQGLSFQCQPGQRIAIVGPSGAGKSTVIALLLRLYEQSSGSVRFDGKEAATYPLPYLRSQMAMVPQEVLLFGGSIKENIAYGRIGASDEEIIAAAKQANAHTFIEGFPDGYETLVGDRGVKLSGGQRQRVAIARAILADPAILILDEATSSLDSESEHQVQQALDSLMKGRTSIIIAHRLSTIRQADQIFVLKDGQVVEHGDHSALAEKPGGVYAMLSKLQFTE